MPELPEVEALVSFLTEHCVGQVVARVDVASINVLKTFAPPVSALQGLEVTGADRLGKFLDLDVSGVHLVVHLARAGWLHWRGGLGPAPPETGEGAIAVRAALSNGGGVRPARGGAQKKIAAP